MCCEDLTENEAFEIVREIEFQDPNWIPETKTSSSLSSGRQINLEVSSLIFFQVLND